MDAHSGASEGSPQREPLAGDERTPRAEEPRRLPGTKPDSVSAGAPQGAKPLVIAAIIGAAVAAAVIALVLVLASGEPPQREESPNRPTPLRSQGEPIGSCAVPGQASSVAADGAHVYVASLEGLHVVDLSDPGAPCVVGAYRTSGQASRVVLREGHVFVADGPGGLRVIDVSDPETPEEVGRYASEQWVIGVASAGDYVCIAEEDHNREGRSHRIPLGRGTLRVLDVSEPENPRALGAAAIRGAGAVAVEGDYAYVADLGGLHVFDVSDPAELVPVGSYELDRSRTGVIYRVDVGVRGDRAYLVHDGDREDGLLVFDVRDATDPLRVEQHACAGSPWDIAIDGDYAYVAFADVADDGFDGGLQMFDVSEEPIAEVARRDTTGLISSVAVRGEHVYATDASGRLMVYRRVARQVTTER